ncbi:hypothetical protein [Brevibacillus halotolerans]|nr:hypothetical protein [Brevibacillus halotolerans]MBA4535496.1 hypothetical protein [Brevibacillus halotolerans]
MVTSYGTLIAAMASTFILFGLGFLMVGAVLFLAIKMRELMDKKIDR